MIPRDLNNNQNLIEDDLVLFALEVNCLLRESRFPVSSEAVLVEAEANDVTDALEREAGKATLNRRPSSGFSCSVHFLTDAAALF